MAEKAVGVDFCGSRVAVAVAELIEQKPMVTAFRVVDCKEGRCDITSAAGLIGACLEDLGILREEVALGLDPANFFFRKYRSPFSDLAHARSTLSSGAEPLLPLLVEELLLEGEVAETSSTGTTFWISAIERKSFREILSTLGREGIDPGVLCPRSAGLLALLDVQATNVYRGKSVLIVELGRASGTLVAIRKGRIDLIRDFALPEERALGLSRGQIRSDWALKGARLEWLRQEINRVFFSLEISGTIDEILFTGEGCPDEKALEELSAVLSKKTRKLTVADAMALRLPEEELARLEQLGACAAGLALTALGTTRALFNFRRGEFRRRSSSEVLLRPLAISLILLAFLFGIGGTYFALGAARARSQTESLREEERAVWKGLFPETVPPSDVAKSLSRRLGILHGVEKYLVDSSLDHSALWMWVTFNKALPDPQRTGFRFEELQVTTSSANASGIVASYEQAGQMVDALKREEAIEAAAENMHLVEKGANEGKVSFNLSARLKGTKKTR